MGSNLLKKIDGDRVNRAPRPSSKKKKEETNGKVEKNSKKHLAKSDSGICKRGSLATVKRKRRSSKKQSTDH